MRLTMLAIAVMATALLLPPAGAAAREQGAASPAPQPLPAAASGEPPEGLGVAAVLATTADGAGGILVQAISVPGMRPEDGIAFWTSMSALPTRRQ